MRTRRSSSTSRKPFVVTSAVRAPRRSSTAFVATVVPCTSSSSAAVAEQLRDAVDDRHVVRGRRGEHLAEGELARGELEQDVGERPADVGRSAHQTTESRPGTTSSEPVISVTICCVVASAVATFADRLPLTQHDDPVGRLEHVLHVVADEEHGHATLAHRAHEVEHLLRLPHAERRRGLVEHDDVPAPGDRAAHGDHLPLAARERRDLAPRLDLEPELPQVLVASRGTCAACSSARARGASGLP